MIEKRTREESIRIIQSLESHQEWHVLCELIRSDVAYITDQLVKHANDINTVKRIQGKIAAYETILCLYKNMI